MRCCHDRRRFALHGEIIYLFSTSISICSPVFQPSRYAGSHRDLRTWRTYWHCVVGFYGAFRFSEINRLSRRDVVLDLSGASVTVHVAHSKTNQYSEGRNRGLSLNPFDPLLCPVTVTRQYLHLLGINHHGSLQPKLNATG